MSAPAFYLGQISYRDIFLGFLLYLGINPFLPTSGFESCQLTWSITLLTCIQTCNITIVIYGYARSLTNHITWHKYQWFITIALWRNRNAREILFTIEQQFCQKLHTDQQWPLFPGKYYWQFTPEEITAVIETRWARLWLICFLSFCTFRHI